MKRVIALLCAVLVVLGCAGCSKRGRTNNVKKFIQNDQARLTAFAEDFLANGESNANDLFDGVEGYEYISPNWMAFLTGSREEDGFLITCGFYYSPDDTVIGYQGEELELAEFGDGYQYLYDNGMEYYTERVMENWYFFEYNFADDREEDPFLKPQL